MPLVCAGGERAVLEHLGVHDEEKLRFQDEALEQWIEFVKAGRVRCKLYQAARIVGTYGLAWQVVEALDSIASAEALLVQLDAHAQALQ